ncbi:SpoIIE family protein phosphatase [Streptomyces sp. NPDC029554]|uniref:SpoIIE family protein phosphatase n=1 Tax=Streptomyces sp. NPDC029554 TaxID=3155126 RepID=UPI003401BE42
MNPDAAVPRPSLDSRFPPVATAVLDGRNRIIGWSREAEGLLGYSSKEILGRRFDALLRQDVTHSGLPSPAGKGERRHPAIRQILHRNGHWVPVVCFISELGGKASQAAWLISITTEERAQQQRMDQGILAGLYQEAPMHLIVYDTQARVRWINSAAEAGAGLTLDEVVGQYPREIFPEATVLTKSDEDATDLESVVERVLRTGEPLIDLRWRSPTRLDPRLQQVWTQSYFRLHDEEGRPLGVCEAGLNITAWHAAQQRLALLNRASGIVGRTLDIRATAEDLVTVVVPEFADMAMVYLTEPVLGGQEPTVYTNGPLPQLRQVAERAVLVLQEPPAATYRHCLASGSSAIDPTGALVVPLRAMDAVLGLAVFVRSPQRTPYEVAELELAEELASRTAVCVDNARRYAREHAAALVLQHDLLPKILPQPSGVDLGHRYRPASGPPGVGGDWYDVIPLSGARVGLVVGDVVGHGLHAAATMGRLRTTVSALAALDLAPEELLARLDDLVVRAGSSASVASETDEQAVGATCLYAIYDPISRQCAMARAGHPAPVLVTPDAHTSVLSTPAGLPLGIGGQPFESVVFDLPEGSTLALYTDGLVENRNRDIEAGIQALQDVLVPALQKPLDQACENVVEALLTEPPADDAALLLVRVHTLTPSQVVTWDIKPEPSAVARCRALVREQLEAWGVNEAAVYIVELVVSELITNAIKYGRDPIRLRLVQDQGLIVEVSDGGKSSPHLRRAANEDEGGRGLFLVAQLTERWGTRHTPRGKTIWTLVPLRSAQYTSAFNIDASDL